MNFPFRTTIHAALLSLIIPAPLPAQPESTDSPWQIDLSTAIRLAVTNDPRLAVYAGQAEAAEGQVEQAGLKPNPVIGTEIENFFGSGPISKAQSLEVTVGIRQLVETAGKRQKRVALAKGERELIDWERAELLAQIESTVREKFMGVLLAMETLKLRKEELALAEEHAIETSRMADAARVPEVDVTRARLAVQQQGFQLKQAESALTRTQTELANTWAGKGPMQFAVTGDLTLPANLPRLDELTESLPYTAPLLKYNTLQTVQEAALDLEEAQAKPDLELFTGARYFNEDDGDFGFVMGVEIPWPLFNQNQGNVRSARARLRAIQEARESERQERVNQLKLSYEDLVSARQEVLMIADELLPAAKSTLEETRTLYQAGHSNQLAVMEARSVLFQIREMHLEAMARYSQATARVESLTRVASLVP